jgi:hypothetical protein
MRDKFIFVRGLRPQDIRIVKEWLTGDIVILSVSTQIMELAYLSDGPSFVATGTTNRFTLPFSDELRWRAWAQSALYGINAAVVGIPLAALYTPVWTTGVNGAGGFALVAAAFLLLFMWQTPPWLVVILCAIAFSVPSAAPYSRSFIQPDDDHPSPIDGRWC